MALNMNQLAAITDPDDDDILHIRNTSGIDVKIKWSDVLEKSIPVGFIYIQFPNETAPSTLFGFGTWTNRSSNWAGDFFRAEGGEASTFESGQQSALMGTHNHQWYEYLDSNGSGNQLSFGTQADDVFSWDSSGSQISAIAGSQDFWTSNITTAESGDETRPDNRTIRIWERTA